MDTKIRHRILKQQKAIKLRKEYSITVSWIRTVIQSPCLSLVSEPQGALEEKTSIQSRQMKKGAQAHDPGTARATVHTHTLTHTMAEKARPTMFMGHTHTHTHTHTM